MLKAVLFDFDGTIADTLPLIFHSFREVFVKYNAKTHSDEEIIAMFGPPEKGIIESHIRPEQREAAFQHYLELYDSKHPELVKAYPDIVKALQLLKDNGLHLGVVTGKGRDSAEISLRHLELAQYFDVIITGDDVEKPKPDPEGLLKAMDRLHVLPSQTVYIGDSNGDIQAGKQAGVRTIGVNWLSVSQSEAFTEKPDDVFDNFRPFHTWILSQI